MDRKYARKIIGDNIYLSPISLDDVEEYTHMVNNNRPVRQPCIKNENRV